MLAIHVLIAHLDDGFKMLAYIGHKTVGLLEYLNLIGHYQMLYWSNELYF